MKFLQVPILFCFRCQRTFIPKIDSDEEFIIIPKACPKRDCRSQTWNISDSELEIIRKFQNRNLLMSPRYCTGIKKSVPVLDKYMPKKKEKSPQFVCLECELFYHNAELLKTHQYRRHHGMCNKCHSSNVYVVKMNGLNVCQSCMESKYG